MSASVRSYVLTERVFGLDALRALSITAVLTSHGLPWLLPMPRLATALGVVGVEVFFALSGFLIGSILIDIEASRGSGLVDAVRVFLIRRWMRTLPLYYVALGGYWLFTNLDPDPRERLWSYVLLTQNLFTPMPAGEWFGPSWSLVIEEWSYIALPMIAFAAFRGRTRPVLAAALLLITLGSALRFVASFGIENLDHDMRKAAWCRSDAVAYGVVAAVVMRATHAQTQVWLRRLLPPALLVVLAAGWVAGLPTVLLGPVGTLLYFPLLGLASAVLVGTASGWRAGSGRVSGATRFVSRISYALYLVHWGVMWGLRNADTKPVPVFAAYILISLLVAGLLTSLVEQPIMRRRPLQPHCPLVPPTPTPI